VASRSNLTCAVCQRDEAEPVVCHHCGRPLCIRCRRTWPDTAFAGADSLPSAYHCSPCLQRHHMHLQDVVLMLSTQIGLGTRSANRRLRRGRQLA
jgi:hypothetical protein